MSTTIVAPARAYSKPTRADMRDYRARLAALTAADVTAMVNPLDPSELFVTPETTTAVDLPRVRPFLPVEWRDAPVHRFEGRQGPQGTWVLRLDVPADHTPRVWASDPEACECSACDSFRFSRVAAIYLAALDLGITDPFGMGE